MILKSLQQLNPSLFETEWDIYLKEEEAKRQLAIELDHGFYSFLKKFMAIVEYHGLVHSVEKSPKSKSHYIYIFEKGIKIRISEHRIYGGTYNYNFIYYHNSPQTNTESILTFRKVLIYHFGIFSTSL